MIQFKRGVYIRHANDESIVWCPRTGGCTVLKNAQPILEEVTREWREIDDIVRMVQAGIGQMWINRDILSNDIYKYLFTVEDVNDAVAKGVPFRDAYREVGMRVHEGRYEHDGRELHHTHEGSIGNLCLENIRHK